MKTKGNFFILNVVPLLKLLAVVYLSIYHYPFYYVLPLYLVIVEILLYKVLELLFKLESLTAFDRIFLHEELNEPYIGITFVETTEGKQQVLVDTYLKIAFKKLPKLRSYLESYYFDYFWKEVTYEDALKKVKVIEDKETIIQNSKDMSEYTNKELKKNRMLIFEGNFPYEIIVFKNPKGKSLVGFKFHHAMSDGMGFCSTFFALGDNYDLSLFPIVPKFNNWFNWLLLLPFMILLYPYYIYLHFSQNLIKINTGASCFKYHNHNSFKTSIELDKNIKEHDIYHEAKEGTLFSISEPFEFSKFSKICKDLKITFHDLFISVLSEATYNYKNMNKFKKEIGVLCPIGLKFFPNKLEETILNNYTFGATMTIPLIETFDKGYEIIKKANANAFRDLGYVKTGEYTSRLMAIFFPHYLVKFLYTWSLKKTDFVVSNVPGPRKSIKYGDCELKFFYPMLTTGIPSSFMTVLSYDNKFVFQFNVNEAVDLDPWEFNRLVQEHFNKILEKHEKILQ